MNIVYKVLVPLAAMLVVLMGVQYYTTLKATEDTLVQSRQNDLSVALKTRILDIADDEVTSVPMSPALVAKFANIANADSSFFRTIVWNRDLTAVYPADQAIRAEEDAHIEAVKSVFASGQAVTWITNTHQSITTTSGRLGPHIVALLALRSAADQTLYVVEVYSSAAIVEKGLSSFAPQLGSIFGVALLAIVLATYGILYLLILRPIGSLLESVRLIASGDLSRREQVRTKDEFGKLSNAFNSMVDNIQKLTSGLEATVAERTQELTQKVFETERLNKAMVGRELKMIELKKVIAERESRIVELEKNTPPRG